MACASASPNTRHLNRIRGAFHQLTGAIVISAQPNVSTYQVGEEVVVRLVDVAVFDVDRNEEVPRERLPKWTIARVTAVVPDGTGIRYMLGARRAGRTFVAMVDAALIEGTA
jgi:hypothetical protein